LARYHISKKEISLYQLDIQQYDVPPTKIKSFQKIQIDQITACQINNHPMYTLLPAPNSRQNSNKSIIPLGKTNSTPNHLKIEYQTNEDKSHLKNRCSADSDEFSHSIHKVLRESLIILLRVKTS
jgi:hypothetical protein